MDVRQLLELAPERHVESAATVKLEPGIFERIELLRIQTEVLRVCMVF